MEVLFDTPALSVFQIDVNGTNTFIFVSQFILAVSVAVRAVSVSVPGPQSTMPHMVADLGSVMVSSAGHAFIFQVMDPESVIVSLPSPVQRSPVSAPWIAMVSPISGSSVLSEPT